LSPATDYLQPCALVYTLGSLFAALVLGAAIGCERLVRQRTARLRTNTLVAVGAAIFVDMASRLNGNVGTVQVVAYVVSRVGCLGAGVIMREEGNGVCAVQRWRVPVGVHPTRLPSATN